MGAGSSAVAGPVSSLDVPLPPLLSQGRGLGSAPPALALVNHSRGPSVPQQPLPETNIFYLEGHRRQMSLLFPSTDSREAEGATWGRGAQRGREACLLLTANAHPASWTQELLTCVCVCVCVSVHRCPPHPSRVGAERGGAREEGGEGTFGGRRRRRQKGA